MQQPASPSLRNFQPAMQQQFFSLAEQQEETKQPLQMPKLLS